MNDESMYERVAFVLGLQSQNWTWLAKKMNYSEQRVSNWKNRGIPMTQLIEIAACLNVSMDWLMTGQDREEVACQVEEPLSTEEEDLLLLWRNLTLKQRQAYYRTLQKASYQAAKASSQQRPRISTK
jgi:hypothetical protein